MTPTIRSKLHKPLIVLCYIYVDVVTVSLVVFIALTLATPLVQWPSYQQTRSSNITMLSLTSFVTLQSPKCHNLC